MPKAHLLLGQRPASGEPSVIEVTQLSQKPWPLTQLLLQERQKTWGCVPAKAWPRDCVPLRKQWVARPSRLLEVEGR